LPKRKPTPTYLFFYLLFLPDTWRIFMGIILAYFLVPAIAKSDMGTGAIAMLYIMTATIGYAVSTKPGKWISDSLKRLILKDKIP
jgi:hypothetical protein